MVWRTSLVPGVRPVFPPELVMQVKALACELPKESGEPLSRYSGADLAREVIQRGIVARISGRTIWRWLDEDAIKPWQHRSWIFPRDPNFQAKAERVLDLYQGVWDGQPLGDDDDVISADEKTSIQARIRLHPSEAPRPEKVMRVEFEYERGGALAYLAAWDVRRAKLFGCCEPTTGIEPFGRLVELVMAQEPYRRAKRVFWIVDNGSSHRGTSAIKRLQGAYLTKAFGDRSPQVRDHYPRSPSPTLSWSAIYTDRMFACPQLTANRYMAKRAPVFAYEFADTNAPGMLPFFPGFHPGASHTGELPFLFDVENHPIDMTGKHPPTNSPSPLPWSSIGPNSPTPAIRTAPEHLTGRTAVPTRLRFRFKSSLPVQTESSPSTTHSPHTTVTFGNVSQNRRTRAAAMLQLASGRYFPVTGSTN